MISVGSFKSSLIAASSVLPGPCCCGIAGRRGVLGGRVVHCLVSVGAAAVGVVVGQDDVVAVVVPAATVAGSSPSETRPVQVVDSLL